MKRKQTISTKPLRAAARQAQRNVAQSLKLAAGASEVIAARTGVSGNGDVHDPWELARIVPEKAVAFSSSGLIWMMSLMRIGAQFSQESRNPGRGMFAFQSGMWMAWTRAASRTLRAQHDASLPLTRAVARNQRRLCR